jgi:hypothetical protein
LQIVAHEIQLVPIIILRGMKRGFRDGKFKEKPAAASVHRWKFQDVPEKLAIAFGIATVQNHMRSDEHGAPPAQKNRCKINP